MPRTKERMEVFARMAVDRGVPVVGVKGFAMLCNIHGFNIVDMMAVDRLHGFDLGVQKYLFQLWFDSSNHKEECYVPPNLQTSISNRLVKIKPPSNITRLPRPLSERSFWKGSEYLNFLHVVITTSGALERLFCF